MVENGRRKQTNKLGNIEECLDTQTKINQDPKAQAIQEATQATKSMSGRKDSSQSYTP